MDRREGKCVRVLSRKIGVSKKAVAKTPRAPRVQQQSVVPRVCRSLTVKSPVPVKAPGNKSRKRQIAHPGGPPVAVKSRRTVGHLPKEMVPDMGKRARTSQLTALECRSVSAEIQNQYKNYYKKFEGFWQDNGIPFPPSLGDADPALADFLDLLYLDGKSARGGGSACPPQADCLSPDWRCLGLP